MVEIGIRFRWRTNFDYDIWAIFKPNAVRAPDTRAVEQIAAESAAEVNSAKLIHCLYNPVGAVGAEAVQFDERRAPCLNFVSQRPNGIVNDFHLVTERSCYSITNFERQKVSA
jgi:hypothetical protein